MRGCRRGRAARRRRRGPGWSGAASGRRGGRAGRAAGRRRRGPAPRRASPEPNVAWISGANASMSGHMTMTSRGSSVGSSARRWRIASRSTSTWRARPWQEWTWTLRSVGVEEQAARRGLRRAARPAGGGRRGRRPAGGAAGCRRRPSTGWWTSAPACAGDDELHLAGVASPRGEQRVVRERGGAVVAAPWRRSRHAGWTCSATRSHRTGDGWSRNRWTSRAAASASSTSTWLAARRVRPNSDRRAGRSTTPGSSRSRSHAAARRSAGLGVPMRSRSSRHSGACQATSGGSGVAAPSVSSPAAQARPSPAGGRRSGRTGRRGGGRRRSAGRAAARRRRRPAPPRWAASGASHASSRCSSTTVEQRPHRPLRQPRVARRGRRPSPRRGPRRRAGRGTGTSTLAHTPSWRPGDAPSTSTAAG